MKVMLFICSLLLVQQCRDTVDNSPNCDTLVKVIDLTGLDGCGLALEKSNGERLIPVEIKPDFELRAGQTLHIGYTILDLADICMAGTTVRVDCIRETSMSLACDQKGETLFPKPEEFDRFVQGAFVLNDLVFENGMLKVQMSYSGCGPERSFKLVMDPAVMKSYPPQRNVRLIFPEEMCEAYFSQVICFPMGELPERTVLHFTDSEGRKKSILVN